MSKTASAFRHVLTVRNVVARYVGATEFSSPEALKKYLHDHPDADKSKHTVKKPEDASDDGNDGGADEKHLNDMEDSLKSKGELNVKTKDGKKFTIKKVQRGGLTTYDIVEGGKVKVKGRMMNDDALYAWLGNLEKDESAAPPKADTHHAEAAKAATRKQETQKHFDEMKSLKTKVDNADHSAQKKFDRAYDKLYEQGETAAKAAQKLMPKLDEDSQQALSSAVSEWERNKRDHAKSKGEHAHEKIQQAEQTWGYATQIDQMISDLTKS